MIGRTRRLIACALVSSILISVVAPGVALAGPVDRSENGDDGGQSQTVYAREATFDDHECDDSGWQFVINQLQDEDHAPDHITVEWSNGEEGDVELDKVTGKVAHYRNASHLDASVTNASAVIDAGWDGQFNLGEGPCHDDVENQPPAATGDTATTDEDAAVRVDVLSNDSDPDGDLLDVTSASDPAHGNVTVALDDTIQYTPDADFHGEDSFNYTASDGNLTDEATVNVTVHDVNDAPTAGFTFEPASPTTQDTVQFTDTSTDVDGRIASWSWDLGDGNTSTDPDPAHSYADHGTYNVTLTVADDDGAAANASARVVVSNAPPDAAFSMDPPNATAGDTVNFTDGSSDPDGSVAAWSWDLGEGNTSDAPSPSHRFLVAGTFNVTLTVTDDDGADATTNRTLRVEPGPLDRIEVSGPDELVANRTATYRFEGADAYGNDVPLDVSSREVTAPTETGTVSVCYTEDDVTGCRTVTVVWGSPADLVIVNGDVDRSADDTTDIGYAVRVTDAYGNEIAVDSSTDVDWSVETGGGNFTGATLTPDVHTGLFEVSAHLVEDPAVSDTSGLRVRPGSIARIQIHPSTPRIVVPGTLSLGADAWDAHGNPVATPRLAWSLDDPSLGSIERDAGVLEVDRVGTGNVTAVHEATGVAATEPVEGLSSAARVERLEISPTPVTVPAGTSVRFETTAYNESDDPIRGIAADFRVSDAPLGRVEPGGSFTGNEVGTGTVEAEIGGITAVANVTVVPGDLARLPVEPGSVTIPAGGNATLSATGLDERGNPVPDTNVSWAVENGSLGSIDADGGYEAHDVEGTNVVVARSGAVSTAVAVFQLDPQAKADAGNTTKVQATSTTKTTANLRTDVHAVGLTEVENGSRLQIETTSGNASEAGMDNATVDVADDARNLTLTVEVQPGSADVVPDEVDQTNLTQVLDRERGPSEPGVFLSVLGTEDGRTLSPERLNALLDRMEVRFRVPVDYFLTHGLDPREVRLLEYSQDELVRSDLVGRYVGLGPNGDTYVFDTVLEAFSSFPVLADSVSSACMGDAVPIGVASPAAGTTPSDPHLAVEALDGPTRVDRGDDVQGTVSVNSSLGSDASTSVRVRLVKADTSEIYDEAVLAEQNVPGGGMADYGFTLDRTCLPPGEYVLDAVPVDPDPSSTPINPVPVRANITVTQSTSGGGGGGGPRFTSTVDATPFDGDDRVRRTRVRVEDGRVRLEVSPMDGRTLRVDAALGEEGDPDVDLRPAPAGFDTLDAVRLGVQRGSDSRTLRNASVTYEIPASDLTARDARPSQLTLLWHDRDRGRWRLAETHLEALDGPVVVNASVPDPTALMVALDSQPPDVTTEGSYVSAGLAVARIGDNRAVDLSGLSAWIDGDPADVHHLDSNHVEVVPRGEIALGDHDVRLVASDVSGLQTARTWTVRTGSSSSSAPELHSTGESRLEATLGETLKITVDGAPGTRHIRVVVQDRVVADVDGRRTVVHLDPAKLPAGTVRVEATLDLDDGRRETLTTEVDLPGRTDPAILPWVPVIVVLLGAGLWAFRTWRRRERSSSPAWNAAMHLDQLL